MWYLLFAVFTVAAAKYVREGECPEPPPAQENFNATAWVSDRWYLISKYPDDPIVHGKCVHAKDSIDGDAYKIDAWGNYDGVLRHIEGSAYTHCDANNSAKFIFSLKFGNVRIEWLDVIIATDYSTYAVSYNCIYDKETNTHQVFPWVKSRARVLEGAAKDTVDEIIQNSCDLDASKFVQVDLSDKACSYTRVIDY